MDESTALVKAESGDQLEISPDEADVARAILAAAKAPRTREAYRKAWRAFSRWCDARGREPLPATDGLVAGYLMTLFQAGRKASTIEQAMAAISEAHKTAGHDSPRQGPMVRGTLQGMRHLLGVATTQKAPILVEDLKLLVSVLSERLIDRRDRALLLVGFSGAFRRSELVSLDVADVAFTADGIEILLRRSKTDQNGVGRKIGIPYGSTLEACPVRSLKAWLEASSTTEGPLFQQVTRHGRLGGRLSGHAVAKVVKRVARAAGLEPSRLSGHSLRAGLATSAAKAGKSERAIMAQTGHRSVAMVRRYIRDATLFTENAAAGLL